jgi:hypothetical protein
MARTQKQNKELHSLLSKLGYDEETKAQLVAAYSDARTDSSAELTEVECENLLITLRNRYQLAEQLNTKKLKSMRSIAIREFISIGWLPEQAAQDTDWDNVNVWMKNHSYLKKRLWAYTIAEFPKLLAQIKTMVENYQNKKE